MSILAAMLIFSPIILFFVAIELLLAICGDKEREPIKKARSKPKTFPFLPPPVVTEIASGLKSLGFSAGEAQSKAHAVYHPGITLEEGIVAALKI